MGIGLRRASSRLVGALADLHLPRPLRAPVYRLWARVFDVDLSELRLALADHPSLGAFFVRRLKPGLRPLPEDHALLPSPCDGILQACDAVARGSILQAKGRAYDLAELLGPLAQGVDLEGGRAWTIYLSPRDYHRVHAPIAARLGAVAWIGGDLLSVAPKVLARRPKVLSINERAVLRLDGARGPLFLVMVGALNVGRIRVVGLEHGRPAPVERPLEFERGGELARFEMGSTVVLVAPPRSYAAFDGLALGMALRLGQPIGRAIPSVVGDDLRVVGR
jgi:phosphatidylserine decarboxylase